MRAPSDTLTIDGEEIAVEKMGEIGGYLAPGRDYCTVLYRDARGRYYVWRMEEFDVCKRLQPGERLLMPDDKARYHELAQPEVTVKRVTRLEAVLWYADEFVTDSRLRNLMRKTLKAGAMANLQTKARARTTTRSRNRRATEHARGLVL